MRWAALRKWKCLHLIRHGLRRATFPYEGKARGRASGGPFFSVLPEKKGEKRGAWTRFVHPASEFRQVPMFQAPFHTRLTLRASWYAPPDTRVPNLQLIAVEQLPSIEGAVEIRMDFTFLRGSL